MPNTPEEEAHISQCNQLINARHGTAKPQKTVQAGQSCRALEGRYRKAFNPVFNGALDAYEVMSLSHTQSCRYTVSRSSPLMAPPCLGPRFLNLIVACG